MLRTLLFVAVVFLITAAVGTGATSAASSAGNDSIINMANSAIQTVNITPMIQLSDQCKQKLMAIFNGSATLGCTNMTKEQENTALQNWAAGCNVSDVFDGIFDSFNQTVTTMLEKQTTVVAEANNPGCTKLLNKINAIRASDGTFCQKFVDLYTCFATSSALFSDTKSFHDCMGVMLPFPVVSDSQQGQMTTTDSEN